MTIIYNHLEQINAELGLKGLTLAREFAEAVVKHAKENAPVRTGFLRDSNAYEQSGDTTTVYNSAPYAAAVDLGHTTVSGSHVPANPFFTQAVYQAQDEMPALIRKVFG